MFILKFKTGNDAFSYNAQDEIARILGEVKSKVLDFRTDGTIKDVNGNTIGSFELTE